MTLQLLTATLVAALLAACGSTPGGSSDAAGDQPTPLTAAPLVPSPTAARSTPRATASPRSTAACPTFPADNIWHSDVSALPVHPRSAAYVSSIGRTRGLHPDFGAGLIDGGSFGIPVTPMPAGQAAAKVTFEYADESDPGPYPIPDSAKVEGAPLPDGDRHVIVLDTTRCRVHELYAAERVGPGRWRAGSGAIFDLRSNALRPAGWTSADAAGLPILAGLVQYDEVARGRIDHAIRVTVPRSQRAYVWPARHYASASTDPALPPMGLRLRLKASVPISGMPPQARVIAQALKTYGVIVADNGSPWFITGTSDSRWSNEQLNALKTLTGDAFEAVDTASLRISPDSAAARRP